MSTKVSDMTWVHSPQPDSCFEVPEVWKKCLCLNTILNLKVCMGQSKIIIVLSFWYCFEVK